MLEISIIHNQYKAEIKKKLHAKILDKVYWYRNTAGTMVQTSHYNFYGMSYVTVVHWDETSLRIGERIYRIDPDPAIIRSTLASLMVVEELRFCFGKKGSILC